MSIKHQEWRAPCTHFPEGKAPKRRDTMDKINELIDAVNAMDVGPRGTLDKRIKVLHAQLAESKDLIKVLNEDNISLSRQVEALRERGGDQRSYHDNEIAKRDGQIKKLNYQLHLLTPKDTAS